MLTRLIMTLLQINKAKKNYRTTKYIKKNGLENAILFCNLAHKIHVELLYNEKNTLRYPSSSIICLQHKSTTDASTS